jgi:cytochrome oxidase Cu insertion factor (SCO1/SenC/PrrC family)
MRRRWIGFALAGIIALLAAGGWVLEGWLAAQQPSRGKALIESEFSLVDHTGKAVTDEDFAGKWQLVFFGFTYCPDVCPTTLNDVSVVLEELGDDAEQVQPLFISVDPERDTPKVMADYVANFDPRIVGLTGSPEQVEAAAQAFRVYYAKVEQLLSSRSRFRLVARVGRRFFAIPGCMPQERGTGQAIRTYGVPEIGLWRI